MHLPPGSAGADRLPGSHATKPGLPHTGLVLPATAAFVLGPGEGPAFGFHGSAAVIKASGADTHDQLAVIESWYPADLQVAGHVHAGEDEMFYLLAGELSVFCEQENWTVPAGSFVFIPRDCVHGFSVSSAGPAMALVITGPPRLDQQIADRGEAPPEWLA